METRKTTAKRKEHEAAAATQSEAQRSDAKRNDDERGTGKAKREEAAPRSFNRALTASLPKEHVCTVR